MLLKCIIIIILSYLVEPREGNLLQISNPKTWFWDPSRQHFNSPIITWYICGTANIGTL